jgi:hypothetical protein
VVAGALRHEIVPGYLARMCAAGRHAAVTGMVRRVEPRNGASPAWNTWPLGPVTPRLSIQGHVFTRDDGAPLRPAWISAGRTTVRRAIPWPSATTVTGTPSSRTSSTAPIPLFHDIQLRQHARLRRCDHLVIASRRTQPSIPGTSTSVMGANPTALAVP